MDYVFICKHCCQPFIVSGNDFNCRILRHGVYKHNMEHIPPHSSKEECDALVRDGLIFGCGRPLRIVDTPRDDNTQPPPPPIYDVVVCDYI